MLKFFSTIALVSTKNNILLLSTTPSSSSFSFSSSWGPSPIAKHYYPSFSFSKFFSTSTAFDKQSFTISYLINSCGFSPQTASNVSQTITLSNSQKPDSVIAFFTTHGFSYSQIRLILTRKPKLLLCKDPNKLLLPKFQFLLSKGASTSDIVRIVNANPKFFLRSLHDHIIPTYHFVRGFLKSDKQTITCINCYISESLRRIESNVKLLLDNGVSHSNIARLLHRRHNILCFHHLWNTVEELKQLGFNASTSPFSVAFLAKRTVNKAKWDHKVETFKKWSWSDQHILQAFKKQPSCMLLSVHKINAIMTFWVHHLGLDSLDLARAPGILKGSLEKTIIPRASVVQFLVSKGLRRKDASIYLPFVVSEKVFLKKFVNGFEEYSSDLLKLYEEKMNLADSRNGLQPGVNQVDQVLG